MPWDNTPAGRKASSATYGDPEYKRNKRLARERSGGRCEIKGPGCTHRGQTIDHDIPISQGGSHALANLRDACWPCHRAKTAGEGGGYRKAASDPPPRPATTW